ncbi:FMN-binding negative transcriptional regulator [Curtobacterium sp. MCJR17_043]|uniref:FMN-binding negative transcriptional regulator n=1 Tax=Curtobacterium sp. MCJR17_043 TaxID=2175660 RepID=UPI0032E88B7E
MRHTPSFLMTEVDEVRRLVRGNPWATIVSSTAEGLVASHYPFLLEEQPDGSDDIVLVSHVGRPDEVAHELGQHEVLVVVQGPHGYVSPRLVPAGTVHPDLEPHHRAPVGGRRRSCRTRRTSVSSVTSWTTSRPRCRRRCRSTSTRTPPAGSPAARSASASASPASTPARSSARTRHPRWSTGSSPACGPTAPTPPPALADEMARVQGTTTTGLEA